MTISGFTMVRNATKLYYPIKQAISSILPLVDEFVVALGDCDSDDRTFEEIRSIGSDKIRIIHTVWDLDKYPRGMEHAHQTDIAKAACKGDWLFYLQSDEVVHEEDLPRIRRRCEELLDEPEVEGILFKYRHFWGDYDHYITSHAWYANEIRIVRNQKDIHSWESAQSFRRIPEFDGLHYREKKGTFKLRWPGSTPISTTTAGSAHPGICKRSERPLPPSTAAGTKPRNISAGNRKSSISATSASYRSIGTPTPK